MFSYKLATAIILGAASAASFATIHTAALDAESAADIAEIATIQELAVANDGLFAPDLSNASNPLCADDLASVFGDVCAEWETTPTGTLVSYVVNAERTHYVLAIQQDSGRVVLASDIVQLGVACEAYERTCLSTVTNDEVLLATPPTWVER